VVGVGDELELEVAGAKKGTTKHRSLAWADVVSGQVQVEFRRHDDGDEDGADDESDDESGA
jgi:hypothetical protein